MIVGTEWLVEAEGCNTDKLRDETVLRQILNRVVSGLRLSTIDSIWHKFPGEGGVTGLIALTESHLACHTYPEYGTATFNLYCCKSRPDWDWQTELATDLHAANVIVTRIDRGNAPQDAANAGGMR